VAVGAKRDRAYIHAALIVAGCYGPNPDYVGITTATIGPASGDSSSDDSTDDSTTAGPLDTTIDPDETTGPPPDPTCGDGHADPGEFCFVGATVSGLGQVQSLAAGDFDGDGKLDLAIGRHDDVRVLFGDGLGGFPLASDLPEPSGNYWGVAAADLDGDQIDDLVASNFDTDDLLVYRALGDGSFAAAVAVEIGQQPTQLSLVELDGDPFLDVLTALRGSDELAVALGDGLGGFAAPTSFAAGGDQPLALVVGHFDQDALVDVVVADAGSHQLALLSGAGAGQFSAPVTYPLDGKPRAVVIADFDLDTHLDVAAPLEGDDRIAVLFGQADGTLLEPALELTVGDQPVGAAVADLDNDGAADLLVMNLDDASVGTLRNDPESPGNFAVHQTLVWFDDFANLAAIVVADFNADGVDDVVVGGSGIRAMISDS
jgi:hypothetical protein